MPGALVVEDDEIIGRILAAGLEEQGHEVTWCVTGALALRAAAQGPVGVCIVDLGLPDAEGLDVVRSLRRSHPQAVIVVATARGEAIDIVAGLDAGADDYLVKPFTMMEVLARLRAHTRRLSPLAPPAPLVAGALTVDTDRRSVSVGGVEAPVRPKELELVALLARSVGRAVSRQVVLRELWPDPGRSAQKSLNVTLTTLRQKLQEAAATAGVEAPVITTLHSFGYRLEADGAAGG